MTGDAFFKLKEANLFNVLGIATIIHASADLIYLTFAKDFQDKYCSHFQDI